MTQAHVQKLNYGRPPIPSNRNDLIKLIDNKKKWFLAHYVNIAYIHTCLDGWRGGEGCCWWISFWFNWHEQVGRSVGRSTANEPFYSTLVVIISISIIVLCYCPWNNSVPVRCFPRTDRQTHRHSPYILHTALYFVVLCCLQVLDRTRMNIYINY